MCAICRRAPRHLGVLCVDCADELISPVTITPEQIQSHGVMDSGAALIDVWGGLHLLATHTMLGRTTDPPALGIFDSSVSRHHARLVRSPAGWHVQDMGSTNRTYVDARAACQPIPITTGQQLRLGYIAFFFIGDASGLAATAPPTLSGRTERRAVKTRTIEVIPARSDLPLAVIEFHQPTGGGVGVVIIDGKRVELTLPQFELVSRLVDRMRETAGDDAASRGFMRPGELTGVLSLETAKPDEDNIRQLVRRVRRACARAGISDLIESRYGMGYRLTVTPR